MHQSIMLLTITDDGEGKVCSLEVDGSLTIGDLISLVAAEFEVDKEMLNLFFNSQLLSAYEASVESVGLVDKSMILAVTKVSGPRSQELPALSPLPVLNSSNPWDFSNIVVENGRATHIRPQENIQIGNRTRSSNIPTEPTEDLSRKLSSSDSTSGTSVVSASAPTASSTDPLSEEFLREQANTLLATCRFDPGALAVLSMQNTNLGNALKEALKLEEEKSFEMLEKQSEGASKINVVDARKVKAEKSVNNEAVGEHDTSGKDGEGVEDGKSNEEDEQSSSMKAVKASTEKSKEENLLLIDLKDKAVKKIVEILKEQTENKIKTEEEYRRKQAAAIANPLSAEAQEFFLKEIQQKQVEDNYLLAQEHLPEAFGSVYMLYVDIEVNGIPLKAFVDSGAQSTFMSYTCAERCNLMRLVDQRFKGIAQGVGKTEIVGRIHMAMIKMGKKCYPASFTILKDDKVEFLFGLDLLRRFQCSIDLKRNALLIEGEEIPFLSEKDISKGMFGRADTQLSIEGGELGTSTSFSPVPSADIISEDKIKKLMDLGFLRSDAIFALENCFGNVEAAASKLLQQAQQLNLI